MRLFLLFVFASLATRAALSPAEVESVRGLLRDHKIAAAESAANTLVAAHPAEAEAYALLGDVDLAKDDTDAAVKACEKAVELAPASSDFQRQLGDCYGVSAQKAGMLSKIGWAKKCRNAYEKAVELDPRNLDARSRLMTYCQQAPSMLGGGIDKAYAQAAEIRKLDATRGRIAFATLYSGEKKFPEAFAELDEILKTMPRNYAALYQLGRVAALSGTRIDEGLAALRQCLAVDPPADSPGHDAANWRLGNLLEKQGDKAAARAAYTAALAINPRFAPAIAALKQLD